MSKKELSDFFQETQENLQISLEKILTIKDSFFDPKVVVNEIRKFIFESEFNDYDDNRYENYYKIIGKAVVIAEAWLTNCSKEVQKYKDTEKSIQEYLYMTYKYRPQT